MAKLTGVLFVTFVISFGFLDAIKAEEAEELDKAASVEEEMDRSAFAKASANVRVRGVGQPFLPAQVPAIQPGHPGQQGQPGMGLIQCHSCVDCPEALPNTPTKWCPRTLDPVKSSSCVTYVEKYKHLKKAWYIRGCASERGSCADIKQAHASQSDIVKLVSCHECEGDKCNSAARSISDVTLAVFTLIITPLLAKITLS
ncbi:hypothetical protein NE865_09261 [Phthorimaea operculella]|nr:hypothetical protein NE865_09261 [Phthorimaea operculella]